MRSWARRTAMAALVAAAFAAAGGGLSGPAFAGTGGDGDPGGLGLLGGNGLLAPVSTVCDDASALLGIAMAGCSGGGTAASFAKPRATSISTPNGSVWSVARARSVSKDSSAASSASTALQGAARSGPLPGPASSAPRQTFSDTLNAPDLGAGNTDTPAASRASGGSVHMPVSALNTADASGMSSDSFAVLAIGALLAGAAALKIASRRARDRKAGIGATI
jgi:hypothetical protein